MQARDQKFAIVGIGCRMPPNASSLAGFWRFLMRGGNALKPIKKDRWDWRQYFDEDSKRPGKTYQRKGGFLDADIQQFDPLVFGISPREAASLDPQQRLLLEVTWEAFEDAGMPVERVSGSATGVFIGGFCLDNLVLQAQPSNRHLINAHSPGGVMMTVLSNRISHAFNLKGPSLTLDTACSSSLVALHYACQSLRLRECDMAMAGGVNVMMRPEFPIIMSKGHFLSPHGECHAFDETAAGYARGEGAGVLLLKRLDDAMAAGDPIHAVVRASGVNQDGHTDGISLPNSEAQEALVRQVYRDAGVPFADVDYIEAHGTGTQAGDSAELGALDRNFSAGRTQKLIVGSVKTNVGHLEAAAGVAGVLKAIGVLKNRQVPKNLHFKTPNPKIPFDQYCLEVAREARTLPTAEEKPTLYAALNSFGYGGTNAHILLESAPPAPEPEATPDEDGAPRLIPFSAGSEEALRDLAGKFAFLIGQGLPGSLADLAYTAAFRRSHLPVRMTALAGGLDELRAQLIAVSTGQPHEGVSSSGKGGPSKPPLVFVFTGMGPQWWGMGQELIRTEPVVAAAIDEIDVHFRALAGWSLKEAMLAEEGASRMARTELAQPANFALQVALARLWESHGIRPAAVVGHSVGEVTAAYVAGVYTLAESVRVSFHRSRLQQTAAGLGSMLAVGLAEDEAQREIAALPGVSVAAINSFSAVTLSGDTDQLKQVATVLDARGVFQKFLRVEVAYHSPQMDPLREELLAALADLAPKPARLPLYSTAHGKIVPGEAWDAEYWWRNVRQAVRFADAIGQLIGDGFSAFLEVGPHPVLGNSIKECAATLERKVTCFASLRRAEPERPRFLLTLGELYSAGVDPDWSALAPAAGRFIPGPQYPWQRQTHWVESERSKMERFGLPGPVYLNRTLLAPTPCWEVEINRNYFPFLFDHGVQDQTVFAGMGYIEAALSLSREVHGKEAVVLENVSFERVLIVDESKLQHLVTEFDADGGRFIISSRVEGEEGAGQRHCRGRLLPQTEARSGRQDLEAWRKRCSEAITPEAFYERLRGRQLFYGPMFRLAAEVGIGADGFLIKIDAAAVADEEDRPLHPSLFDVALQAVIYCASGEQLFVPSAFEQFQYFSKPVAEVCYAVGQILRQSSTQIVASVWLTDPEGKVHAHARHITLQSLEMEAPGTQAGLFYEMVWKPVPRGEAGPAIDGAKVLVLYDEDSDVELAKALAGRWPGAETASAFDEELHAGRRQIIVLWAGGELNEKWIGLLQALGRSRETIDVTLVTSRAKAVESGEGISNLAATSLAAVGLVAQNEFDGLSCRSIDFDVADAESILAEISAGSRGDIAYRGGLRYVSVLAPRKETKAAEKVVATPLDEPLQLRAGASHFEAASRVAPGAGEIELRVHRAVLREGVSVQCAGVVVGCGPGSGFAPGDRVVAVVPDGLRSYATGSETFAVKIPETFGMEAAAIPLDYLTAWRGLVEIAHLQAGERVLIPHATDAAGLAALDVARSLGAEIFATTDLDEEREFLRGQGVTQIFSAADLDFGPAIREATNHEGVDVVIGAFAGQARAVALSLLRSGGRYIETGKKDIAEDRDLPLRAFDRNVLFAALDIERLARERPDLVRLALHAIFKGFAEGRFKLAPVRTFAAGDAVAAFREANGIGPALLDLSTGEVEVPEAEKPLVRADGCYIVTGGTSGFGLVTAQWLARQGAGRIILASRSGPKAPGLAEALPALAESGAKIEVASADVSDAEQVRALVERAGPALRGIVHGAMVLEDAMMSDLSIESFRRVFGPKAVGALNLARAVEGRADLDFLVFYSSVSALVGNRGQTSYVAANALLDGLAHALRARGVPATSVNWGALAESGVVARDEHLGSVLASAGITGLRNDESLTALEKILAGATPQVGVFKVDWARWLDAHAHLADDPRFQGLRADSADENGAAAQVRRALADASREQRLRVLEEHLQEVLAETLKMAKDSIPMDRRLNEMGVDSLLVLELSLGIQERIGVNFSAMEFLKGPTLQELATLGEAKLWKN